MKINFTKGSDKQRAWAQDIIDSAYMQLDCMDRNVDNVLNMSYTHEQVGEVRKFLDTVCSQEIMQDAAHVINVRSVLTPTSIERTVRETAHDNKVWDADSIQWIDRK